MCLVWVGDTAMLKRTEDKLLTRVMEVLSRLVERRIYTEAHTAVFFPEEIKWRWRLYSRWGMRDDP